MAERVEILIQAVDRASGQLSAINQKLDEMNQRGQRAAGGTDQLTRSFDKLTSGSSLVAGVLTRLRSLLIANIWTAAAVAVGVLVAKFVALAVGMRDAVTQAEKVNSSPNGLLNKLLPLRESTEAYTKAQRALNEAQLAFARLDAAEKVRALNEQLLRVTETAKGQFPLWERLTLAATTFFDTAGKGNTVWTAWERLSTGAMKKAQAEADVLKRQLDLINLALGTPIFTSGVEISTKQSEDIASSLDITTAVKPTGLDKAMAKEQEAMGSFITEKTTEFLDMGGIALGIWVEKLQATTDAATAYNETLAQINLQHVEGENRVTAATYAVEQLQLAYQNLMNMATFAAGAIGAAFAQAIVYDQNFGEAMKGALKAIAAMIIQLIVQTLIKKFLSSVVEIMFHVKLLKVELTRYATATYAAAFASSVAFLGPGAAEYAAGMTQMMLGGAIVAGAQGAATGAGIGSTFKDVGAVPAMAEGGIVTQPTIALIGEAGPEAVVPLGKDSGNMGGYTLHVSFSGPVLGDRQQARQFAVMIDEALFELKKRGHSLALAT